MTRLNTDAANSCFIFSGVPPRVLVTGASGFVGKHLCSVLLAKGYPVYGTSRAGTLSHGISSITIPDITCADWSVLLAGIDCVVHLAAFAHQIGKPIDPAEVDRVNHKSVVRLADAVADSPHVRRLVFISSIGAVCTTSSEVITEKTQCKPDSAYGKSKRAAELAIQHILSHTAADWCILRPTLVYGPGNPGNMLRLTRLAQSRIPLPFGAIRNRRTLLYVGNLADAILKCIEHENASRQIFNLSDGKAFSTPELLRMVARAFDHPLRLFSVPPRILRLLGGCGDTVSSVLGRSVSFDSYSIDRLLGSLEVDISLLKSLLRWQPPFTPEEGFRRTVQCSLN